MNCYTHPDTPAVAVCKTCNRGVCKTCAHDTAFHITCSTQCDQDASEAYKMMQLSKRIYGIGVAKRPMPLNTVMMGGLGLVFVLWAVTTYWQTQKFNGFAIIFGGFCLLIGVLSYWRAKKMGLSC